MENKKVKRNSKLYRNIINRRSVPEFFNYAEQLGITRETINTITDEELVYLVAKKEGRNV